MIGIVIPIFAKSKKDLDDLQNLFLFILALTYPPDIVILVADGLPLDYKFSDHFLHIKQIDLLEEIPMYYAYLMET